jgi:hypothetical protein
MPKRDDSQPRIRTEAGYPRGATAFGFPPDVLLAVPARDGEEFFRLVNEGREAHWNYESAAWRRKPSFPVGPSILNTGISVFGEPSQALRMARRFPKVIARVTLEDELGFYVARTLGQEGHFTLWGDPYAFERRAEIVYRREEEW